MSSGHMSSGQAFAGLSTSSTPKTGAEALINDANIDPALRDTPHAQFRPHIKDSTLVHQHVFAARLEAIKRREPLKDACAHFGISHAKRANLEKLRAALVKHWYNGSHELIPPISTALTPARAVAPLPRSATSATPATTVLTPRPSYPADSACSPTLSGNNRDKYNEDELASRYGVAEVELGLFDSGFMESAEEDEDQDIGEDADMELDLEDDSELSVTICEPKFDVLISFLRQLFTKTSRDLHI
ncbi:hypothetical protein DXG01_005693 [Tephrocybe rancida]|nr:hypothetical protein DXG01_005693 [Tephrocybe rancida]